MIRELIENKTAQEKANLKALEIAKIRAVPRVPRKDYDIEIVEINAIEGGVEVFARAWKDGKQIGFGKDGSVDIERFRVFNPPILVPDDNGDILQEWTDDISGERGSRRLREDLGEALMQVLEHNLSVMKNVHTGTKIERGKRGNTTSTFYPSIDGWAWNDPTETTWSTVHDAASGTTENTGAAFLAPLVQSGNSAGNTKGILRSFMRFDTSSLPDTDTIDSATISMWMLLANRSNALSTSKSTDSTWSISRSTDVGATITKEDFDLVDNNTGASTAITTAIAYASISTGAYNDFALNATGIAHIDKTTFTTFAYRNWNWDGSDVDPNASATSKTDRQDASSVDATGTTQDPKLVVEHGAAAASPRTTQPTLLTLGVG